MSASKKLAPFRGMIDTLDADALAATAGVSVDEAAAFIASVTAPVPADEPKATTKHAKASKATPAPAAEPVEVAPVVDAAPASVRVTFKGRIDITGQDGKPTRLGYRDVYSGDYAAYLWTAYRNLVEAYPKA